MPGVVRLLSALRGSRRGARRGNPRVVLATVLSLVASLLSVVIVRSAHAQAAAAVDPAGGAAVAPVVPWSAGQARLQVWDKGAGLVPRALNPQRLYLLRDVNPDDADHSGVAPLFFVQHEVACPASAFGTADAARPTLCGVLARGVVVGFYPPTAGDTGVRIGFVQGPVTAKVTAAVYGFDPGVYRTPGTTWLVARDEYGRSYAWPTSGQAATKLAALPPEASAAGQLVPHALVDSSPSASVNVSQAGPFDVVGFDPASSTVMADDASVPVPAACVQPCYPVREANASNGVRQAGALSVTPSASFYFPEGGAAERVRNAQLGYAMRGALEAPAEPEIGRDVNGWVPAMVVSTDRRVLVLPVPAQSAANAVRVVVWQPQLADASDPQTQAEVRRAADGPGADEPQPLVSTMELNYFQSLGLPASGFTVKDSYTDAQLPQGLVPVDLGDPASMLDSTVTKYRFDGATEAMLANPCGFDPLTRASTRIGRGFAKIRGEWQPVVGAFDSNGVACIQPTTTQYAHGNQAMFNALMTTRLSGQVAMAADGSVPVPVPTQPVTITGQAPAPTRAPSGSLLGFGFYQQVDAAGAAIGGPVLVTLSQRDGSSSWVSAQAADSASVAALRANLQPLLDAGTQAKATQNAASLDLLTTYQLALGARALSGGRRDLAAAIAAQSVIAQGEKFNLPNGGRTVLTPQEAGELLDPAKVNATLQTEGATQRTSDDLRVVLRHRLNLQAQAAAPTTSNPVSVSGLPTQYSDVRLTPLTGSSAGTANAAPSARDLLMARLVVSWIFDEIAVSDNSQNQPLGDTYPILGQRLAREFPDSSAGERDNALRNAWRMIGIDNAYVLRAQRSGRDAGNLLQLRTLLSPPNTRPAKLGTGPVAGTSESACYGDNDYDLSGAGLRMFLHSCGLAGAGWVSLPADHTTARGWLAAATYSVGDAGVRRAQQQMALSAYSRFQGWALSAPAYAQLSTDLTTAATGVTALAMAADPAGTTPISKAVIGEATDARLSSLRWRDLSAVQLDKSVNYALNAYLAILQTTLKFGNQAVDSALGIASEISYLQQNSQSFVTSLKTGLQRLGDWYTVDYRAVGYLTRSGQLVRGERIGLNTSIGANALSALLSIASIATYFSGDRKFTTQDLLGLAYSLANVTSATIRTGYMAGFDLSALSGRWIAQFRRNGVVGGLQSLIKFFNEGTGATHDFISAMRLATALDQSLEGVAAATFVDVLNTEYVAGRSVERMSADLAGSLGRRLHSVGITVDGMAVEEAYTAALTEASLPTRLLTSAGQGAFAFNVGLIDRAMNAGLGYLPRELTTALGTTGRGVNMVIPSDGLGFSGIQRAAVTSWVQRTFPEEPAVIHAALVDAMERALNSGPVGVHRFISATQHEFLRSMDRTPLRDEAIAALLESGLEGGATNKSLAAVRAWNDEFGNRSATSRAISRASLLTSVVIRLVLTAVDVAMGVFQAVMGVLEVRAAASTQRAASGWLNFAGGVLFALGSVASLVFAQAGAILSVLGPVAIAIAMVLTVATWIMSLIPDPANDRAALDYWIAPFADAKLTRNPDPAQAKAELYQWHEHSPGLWQTFPSCAAGRGCSSVPRTATTQLALAAARTNCVTGGDVAAAQVSLCAGTHAKVALVAEQGASGSVRVIDYASSRCLTRMGSPTTTGSGDTAVTTEAVGWAPCQNYGPKDPGPSGAQGWLPAAASDSTFSLGSSVAGQQGCLMAAAAAPNPLAFVSKCPASGVNWTWTLVSAG